jgi:hypothetical protein
MILHNKDLHEGMMDAFSNDTELLTQGGWKRIDSIGRDDMVAQYDHKDSSITFTIPRIIPVKEPEHVYEITAPHRQARQVVSFRHTIYFEYRDESTDYAWVPRTCEAHELTDNLMNASMRFITSGRMMNSGNGMTASERAKIAIRESGTPIGDAKKCTMIAFDMKRNPQSIARLQKIAIDTSWHMKQEDSHTVVMFVPNDLVFSNAYIHEHPLDTLTYEWCRDFMNESSFWGDNTNDNGHGATYRPRHHDDFGFYAGLATLSGYESNQSKDDNLIKVSYETKEISAEAFTINDIGTKPLTGIKVPSTYVITRNGERPVISGCMS